MKNYLTLLCFFAFLNFCSITGQTCLPGGINFTSQSEIDIFTTDYPGCTEILGNVSISGAGITNLNGLSPVTSIGGHLDIHNSSLTNLTGLNSLISVGGSLYINENLSLLNLSGLNALTSIGGNCEILLNNSLINLTGLN